MQIRAGQGERDIAFKLPTLGSHQTPADKCHFHGLFSAAVTAGTCSDQGEAEAAEAACANAKQEKGCLLFCIWSGL